uniref:Major facilitator superfamily (MFS) profile domain-containing protein n=1 Tax=Ciona savignyi TaxID=51511 RepID=H2Y7Q1_CIOSA
MRSVLLLYLRDYLHWDDDTSTSVYHAFTVLAYLFPLLGAIVADSYWGKYKTIIYLSIVYVFGHIVKTIGSIPYVPSQVAHAVLSMFGLFFIAVGTGGIKPCVSSFGGDQFKPGQSYIRKQFFSLFYFAINAGSLISTFVTPIFRADVDCYPNETAPEFDQCFALAFGVPGALMVVALILFIAGTRWYTIYPPEGSIITKFCMCIYTACRNRWNTPKQERNKEHWLEYADSPPKLIRDTKYVLRVLVLYIPLPFFWALFDQQGSRWTLQAIQTNGYLGSLLIKPDQVEVLNPLLIVTLIPLFEATLYPFLRYFNIPFPPLRRMTVGLILAGCSFIAAAILQIEIDVRWLCFFVLIPEIVLSLEFDSSTLPHATSLSPQATPRCPLSPWGRTRLGSSTHQSNSCCILNWQFPLIFNLTQNNQSKVLILFGISIIVAEFTYLTCNGDVRSISTTGAKEQVLEFVIFGNQDVHLLMQCHVPSATIEAYNKATIGNDTSTEGSGGGGDVALYSTQLYLDVGGVYSIVYDGLGAGYTNLDLNPNTVNVAWMIPQFLIITVGEVFLSVTGLEFSYTQAPPSMKSVLTSIWLFTVSLGNIIVLIIAEAKGIEKQSDEFFLFAGLIFVAALLFIFLAYRYIPVDENEFKEEILEEERKFRERARIHALKKKGLPYEDIESEDIELPDYSVVVKNGEKINGDAINGDVKISDTKNGDAIKAIEYEHDTEM